jgi:hypothetical protein
LFHIRPASEREQNITRIMSDAGDESHAGLMVDRYMGLYQDLLNLR